MIDGPPVLESNYARFLSQRADAIVFVVEWDKTNRDGVIEALDRLGDAEATLVFNKVDLNACAFSIQNAPASSSRWPRG